MKKNEVSYPIIKIIKPFFWKKCRFCDKEFKKEAGYSIWDYTKINPHLYTAYCCNKCASNIKDVEMLLIQSEISKPPPPPTKQR